MVSSRIPEPIRLTSDSPNLVDDATAPGTFRYPAQATDPFLVAVIPAFNEARFIGSVVLLARQNVQAVVVVDDGSTDTTAAIAEAAGAVVVRHAKNRGKGAALNTGLHKARELNPSAVITLDGDGQHLPGEMAAVVAPILAHQADIVVGSRYLEKKSDVPSHRVLGHWAFNLLTNRASGVNLTDSQSGFRAFSPAAVDTLVFQSDGFSVESEMQFIAHERGLRMLEVPVTISYLDKPKRPVTTHGLMVLNGVLRFVGQYRPLLFFGVIGLVALAIGIAWGLLVIDIYSRTKMLAVGYALLSLLFGLGGTLCLFCGIILHSVRGLLLDIVAGREPIGHK
jgi:glycosyltransferase involved in cell wall biosynthesis